MQMKAIIISQLIGMTIAYAVLMLAVPAMAFDRRLSGHRVMERFFLCLVTGNCYVILLVLLLSLFRICNAFTLLAGLLLPLFISWKRHPLFPLRERPGISLSSSAVWPGEPTGRRASGRGSFPP